MDPEGTQNQEQYPGTNQYPGLPPSDDSTNTDPYQEYTRTGDAHETPSVAEVLSGRAGRANGERMTIRRMKSGSGDEVVELFKAEIKSLNRQRDKRAKQAAWQAEVDALTAPLKPAQILANRATALGYPRRSAPKPWSHGQDVFFNGRKYISEDIDAHNVSNGWKMFDKKGNRLGTFDANLNPRKR